MGPNYVINLDGLRKTVEEVIRVREEFSFGDDDLLRDYLGDEAYVAFVKLTLSSDMVGLAAACVSALFSNKTGKIIVTEEDPDYEAVDNFISVLCEYKQNGEKYKKVIEDRLAELAG